MSKKLSASRKRAFLTYLAQSGNQTLSAERAKVSRSWVQLHRSMDAGFDAACVAAIAAAESALRAPTPGPSLAGRGGSNAPPAGWKYFEGHELVVRGTGGSGSHRAGRRVQIGRARVRQWTARAETRFLAVLSATGNVHAAAAEVSLCLSSAYNHAQRWPGFAEAWRAAAGDGYESLEAALALEGRNLFAGAAGADDDDEPAARVRIVGMTAEHALACLNAYRKLVPIDRYPAAVQEADAAAKAATEERLWRKLALLRAEAETPPPAPPVPLPRKAGGG